MYFPFTQNSIEQMQNTLVKPNVISDKLLNSPYPASSSYSTSGSY
uniref:Uncharacterized protein n=1 Tax=viral metagenome TaxID=1070528 RepID=A0A6C0DWI6_9ZZZZ